jgi:hypothetical protein
MKKVSLLFGIHMHQPVDNFGEAVDEAVKLCYEPFFETMAKYPEFKFCVHSSGWLLETIRTNHPKVFKNMKKLTQSGSIEWVSAGFYEPVLSSIPSCDRIAQIQMLNNYLHEHFGVKPDGLWLTERVWESSIIPDLKKAGIEYALVDDYHFLSNGFESSKMDGFYQTEEGGEMLGLFPISKPLRYALPFFSVENAIKEILNIYKNSDSAAIIFDDAEKFGLWPKTNKWVYEQKWLEKFIKAVLKHEQIQTKHYKDHIKESRSRGLAYLSNTSYFEMGEWSLRGDLSLKLEALKDDLGDDYFETTGIALIKGGIWKNFFIKYHESNYIHKRMLYFSLKQKSLSQNSLERLYKMQTNDVFWHGVFGGIYLPNLRDNAYKYLLEMESSQAKDEIKYEHLDIDKDGYDELKVLTNSLSLVFSSRWGGQMIEFGSLDALFNWQNTLMRRSEPYHEKILNPQDKKQEKKDGIDTIHNSQSGVDESLKDELKYDWHPKNSFIDHFSTTEPSLDSFKNVAFNEVGDFANEPFELDKENNIFLRDGGIYLDKPYKSSLKKQYSFYGSGFELNVSAKTEYKESLFYAQECNFHFAHPNSVTINKCKIDGGTSFSEIDELEIADDFTNKKIKLIFNKKCKVFAYILNTVSLSEDGYDKVAQQISFLFSFQFREEFDFKMSIGVVNV